MHINFTNPPNEYRIKPFWFLNGDLDDNELKAQLDEMKAKGIGGVFICARQGLKIPYLSKKWFSKIKTICDYADSIGLENWLYDEYPYPSGISGGEVTVRHPQAKAKQLIEHIFDARGNEETWYALPFCDVIYACAFPINSDNEPDFESGIDIRDDIGNLQAQEVYQNNTGLTQYNKKRYFTYEPTKYLSVVLPQGNWRILIVMQDEIKNFKYYGNYVDVCDKEAMQTFIETTHSKYVEYLGESFNTVKGMFSDEVGFVSAIPWTRHVVAEMKRLYGYETCDFVPALYLSSYKDAYKIRYRYYKAIHDLLMQNYYKPVSDWCDSHGIALACECQSMRMSTQRYSHIVGGDTAHEKLGKDFRYIVERNLHSFRANPKSVSSLTRQLNQRFSMIESFHSVGWSMTIQDAKWMFDRMAGFGINFYNIHAYYYTMESIVKHDAPPSQFIQNAYWKHYKKLGDYTARLSVFVTETDTNANIAVLDPIAGLWALLSNPFYKFTPYARSTKWEQDMHTKIYGFWGDIRKELIYDGVDFDNLDAEILNESEIIDGQIVIGRAKYDVLILPPLMAIEKEATDKIKQFLAQGGTLIGVGDLPFIDIDDENVKETYTKIFEHANAHLISTTSDVYNGDVHKHLMGIVSQQADNTVQVSYDARFAKTMLVTKRYDADGALYIYISNQENNHVDVNITIAHDEPYHFQQLSFEDGGSVKLPVTNNKCTIAFQPYDCKALKLARGEYTQVIESLPALEILTGKLMDVYIEGENVLPLDSFEFSVDEKEWASVDVSTAENQLDTSGFAITGGQAEIKVKGFGLPKQIVPTYPKKLYYRKKFYCDYVPNNINILMDESTILQGYDMYINGCKVDNATFAKSFVNDIKNIKTPITGLVKEGENELYVVVTAENGWGGIRDNIYISGDFAVTHEQHGMTITKPTGKAELTHTYIHGYPYYCGTFRFKSVAHAQSTGRYAITLSEKKVYDCVEVVVNGVSAGVRAFAPYTWEADLVVGDNDVEIMLTNTLIGMLEGGYFDYDAHQFVKVE